MVVFKILFDTSFLPFFSSAASLLYSSEDISWLVNLENYEINFLTSSYLIGLKHEKLILSAKKYHNYHQLVLFYGQCPYKATIILTIGNWKYE